MWKLTTIIFMFLLFSTISYAEANINITSMPDVFLRDKLNDVSYTFTNDEGEQFTTINYEIFIETFKPISTNITYDGVYISSFNVSYVEGGIKELIITNKYAQLVTPIVIEEGQLQVEKKQVAYTDMQVEKKIRKVSNGVVNLFKKKVGGKVPVWMLSLFIIPIILISLPSIIKNLQKGGY